MTKARDLANFNPTNITDTGTEGTKVASGTTAQRGSTTGQIRFNSTIGLAEYYTGTAFKAIDAPPTVSSLDVTEVDSQAGGNQTIVITGSGFNSGATVTFVGNAGTDFNASTVTIDSATQITAVAPKASFLNAQEPYGVKVENTSGLSGTLASQINVDTSPSWQTASGTLATINDIDTGTHSTVSATDADGDTIVYSETTSVLSGAGLSLNSSTGAISGNPTDVSASTTNTFTLRATANTKTVDRSFNIIVNPVLDGASSARANTSASSIKTLTSTTTDGLYWIKPSGYGGSAFQIYCRMSNIGTETGGYMLLGSFIGDVASNSAVSGYSQYDHTRDSSLNRTQGDTPTPSSSVSPSRSSTTHRYLNSTYIDAIRNGGSNTKLLGFDRYKNVAVTSTDSEMINLHLNNQSWGGSLVRDTDRNTVIVYDPSNNASFLQNNTARWHPMDNGMAVREVWTNAGDNNWILGHRGDIWTASVSSALHNEYYIK
jgi:hypothetical protein